jgi:DIS3-like exonuclease 2
MRATGEHTAAVPIPAPSPPPPAAAASAAEESEKEKRKNRRRPARRSKQAGAATPAATPQSTQADAAGPRSVRSMPPMHVGGGARVDAEAEAPAAGTSQSCPLLPTPRPAEALAGRAGGSAPWKRYFQPHWPEEAVEEAVKVFAGAMGGLQLAGRDFCAN